MRSRYLVKIIPPAGYRIYRLQFSRRHVVLAGLFALVAAGLGSWWYVSRIGGAEARAAELRELSVSQHDRLHRIDRQAEDLDDQLRSLETQNEVLRRMIGADPSMRAAPAAAHASRLRRERDLAIGALAPDGLASSSRRGSTDDFGIVAARIAAIEARSAAVRAEGDRLRAMTMRVLNVHRLAELSRAAQLASIPSISPTGSDEIASPFGWRLVPWPEFHQGLDLVGDYGLPVRASAAGRVVFASFDPGGYGNRIEIDHGNGYHTWYCHLQRIDVGVGAYVRKAQHIGEVGSTGESTGPHLHYQVMFEGKPVDPEPYITGVPARVLAALK